MQRCMGCMQEFPNGFDVCPHCGYFVGTPVANRTHLLPGTVLHGRYTLGKVLGQGGFGITYIAWDANVGRTVAVKEYLPNALASRMTGETLVSCYSEAARQQFRKGVEKTRKEANALSQFDSLESVVRVYDCIEENNTAYIIMELLRGKTAKEILSERGTLTLAETMRIMTPVLQTLDAMHQIGMIHRDVAPDNIFVCDDGRIKLLDFGAARVVTGTGDKSLSVMLKHGYAPIEQYSAKSQQGPCTDVYAVCATMCKMMTGITPESSLDRMSKNTPPPIMNCRQIPDPVKNILVHGMAINAADRIQSAHELLAQLQHAMHAEPAATVGTGRRPSQDDHPKPRNLKAVVIAAAALVLTAAVACGIVFAVRSNSAKPIVAGVSGIDSSVKVGDTVTFGTYGIEGEKAQPIEWTVLDRSGNQVLLLSTKGLDYQTCHGDSGKCFTWETSWIREWLNTDFYDAAFSDAEKDRITIHENATPGFEEFGITGGNNTRDRCFLLSMQEVEKYFPTQEQRKAECTDALFRREFRDWGLNDSAVHWMLRSPGRNTYAAEENMYFMDVWSDGSFSSDSNGLQDSVIRPAIWVDLAKNGGHAAESWTSGYREHLYDFSWDFTGDVLTLSGNGVMPNVTYEWGDDVRQNVKTVVIKAGLTTIVDCAFQNCVNLTSAQIPDSVKEIGSFAFQNCKKLTKLSIPSSVERIGQAIYYQSGLPSNKDYWKNGLFCIDHCLLRANKSLSGKVIIPNFVTVIADFAFYECPITEAVIPEGVLYLGVQTFGSCAKLVSVYLPDSIRRIFGAFVCCDSLENIHLPEQLQYIEWGFYACKSLATITLPKQVKYIEDQAFSGCWELQSVTMYPGIEHIGNGVFFNTALETVYFYGTEAEWNAIQIDADNEDLMQAEIQWKP